jgi:hypothetical protein
MLIVLGRSGVHRANFPIIGGNALVLSSVHHQPILRTDSQGEVVKKALELCLRRPTSCGVFGRTLQNQLETRQIDALLGQLQIHPYFIQEDDPGGVPSFGASPNKINNSGRITERYVLRKSLQLFGVNGEDLNEDDSAQRLLIAANLISMKPGRLRITTGGFTTTGGPLTNCARVILSEGYQDADYNRITFDICPPGLAIGYEKVCHKLMCLCGFTANTFSLIKKHCIDCGLEACEHSLLTA